MGRSNGHIDAAKPCMGRSTAPRFSYSQRVVDRTVITSMNDRESAAHSGGKPMAALNDTDLDTRIERKLHTLGMIVRDDWHDAASAAAYLKMSKARCVRDTGGTINSAPQISGYALRRRSEARTLARNCSGVSGGGVGASVGFTKPLAAAFVSRFAAWRAITSASCLAAKSLALVSTASAGAPSRAMRWSWQRMAWQ